MSRTTLTEAFWKTYEGQKVKACLDKDSCSFDLKGPLGEFHVAARSVCSRGFKSFLDLQDMDYVKVSLIRGRVNRRCELSTWPDSIRGWESFEVELFVIGKRYE